MIIRFSASWKKALPKICLEVKIPDASIFIPPASVLSEEEVSSQIYK